MVDFYVPRSIGVAALAELDEVDWRHLGHAYSQGDVPGALRLLGKEETLLLALESLFGLICHQGGTIYEASPHAFPFIAAWAAAAPLVGDTERAIVMLLGSLAVGEGHPIVQKWMREAIVASDRPLQLLATCSPLLAELVDAMTPVVNVEALDELIHREEEKD